MSEQSRILSHLAKLVDKRAMGRWGRAVDAAEDLDLDELKTLRARARALRRRLDKVLHIADGRLALPLIGSNAFNKPLHADWIYRPELWRGPVTPLGLAALQSKTVIGNEATVFHDCQLSELTYRQIRNTREEDLAPFGVRFDVFRFDGSFLSLVIDLPHTAVEEIEMRHVFRVETTIETEKPLEMFARLNVKHGPNTEQLVREFPGNSGEISTEFDLLSTKMNAKRVERIWVEIIFEGPELNQIVLRDVTLSRRPRAEL